ASREGFDSKATAAMFNIDRLWMSQIYADSPFRASDSPTNMPVQELRSVASGNGVTRQRGLPQDANPDGLPANLPEISWKTADSSTPEPFCTSPLRCSPGPPHMQPLLMRSPGSRRARS